MYISQMRCAEDYGFILECIADDAVMPWPYDNKTVIIGVHKFMSVDAATNALMNEMRSFYTEKAETIFANNDPYHPSWYTTEDDTDGFMIVKHTPGVDGWILRGSIVSVPVIKGRVARAMHVRPDSHVDISSLEQSLVFATEEKSSMEQDIHELREQLRDLASAMRSLKPDESAVGNPRNTAIVPVPPPAPVLKPSQITAVPPSELVAELSSFNRTNLLSRSQRDKKLSAKNEPLTPTVQLAPADDTTAQPVVDDVDKYDVIYDTEYIGGDCEFDDYEGYVSTSSAENIDNDMQINSCSADEPASPNLDIHRWSEEWIDDRVMVRSPRLTPRSSPIDTPSCSPENDRGLLWSRRPMSGDSYDRVSTTISSPNAAMSYPWSAPGYMTNVAFSNSTTRFTGGFTTKSPKYE